MRNIEFRGRNMSGMWLYGSLYENGSNVYILPKEDNGLLPLKELKVAMNTVGLCTNHFDADLNLIYDGDILRRDSQNGTTKYLIVVFSEKTGGFIVYGSPDYVEIATKFEGYSVVGNIYEESDASRYISPVLQLCLHPDNIIKGLCVFADEVINRFDGVRIKIGKINGSYGLQYDNVNDKPYSDEFHDFIELLCDVVDGYGRYYLTTTQGKEYFDTDGSIFNNMD